MSLQQFTAFLPFVYYYHITTGRLLLPYLLFKKQKSQLLPPGINGNNIKQQIL